MKDQNSEGAVQLSNVLLDTPKYGTLEWWFSSNDVYKTSKFVLDLSDSWLKIELRIKNNKIEYYRGSGIWEPIPISFLIFEKTLLILPHFLLIAQSDYKSRCV